MLSLRSMHVHSDGNVVLIIPSLWARPLQWSTSFLETRQSEEGGGGVDLKQSDRSLSTSGHRRWE